MNNKNKQKNKKEKKVASKDLTSDGKPSSENDWLPSYTSDQLFLEMCRTIKKAIIYAGTNKEREINWYHAEAAIYARRSSAGRFRGKNAKYKPVFHLDLNTFSNKLKAALTERAKTSKEAIHQVIQDAVFKILRARHEMIFYQYIEHEPLRWKII